MESLSIASAATLLHTGHSPWQPGYAAMGGWSPELSGRLVDVWLALDALLESGDSHEEKGSIDDVGIVAEFLSYEVIELVVHRAN